MHTVNRPHDLSVEWPTTAVSATWFMACKRLSLTASTGNIVYVEGPAAAPQHFMHHLVQPSG